MMELCHLKACSLIYGGEHAKNVYCNLENKHIPRDLVL